MKTLNNRDDLNFELGHKTMYLYNNKGRQEDITILREVNKDKDSLLFYSMLNNQYGFLKEFNPIDIDLRFKRDVFNRIYLDKSRNNIATEYNFFYKKVNKFITPFIKINEKLKVLFQKDPTLLTEDEKEILNFIPFIQIFQTEDYPKEDSIYYIFFPYKYTGMNLNQYINKISKDIKRDLRKNTNLTLEIDNDLEIDQRPNNVEIHLKYLIDVFLSLCKVLNAFYKTFDDDSFDSVSIDFDNIYVDRINSVSNKLRSLQLINLNINNKENINHKLGDLFLRALGQERNNSKSYSRLIQNSELFKNSRFSSNKKLIGELRELLQALYDNESLDNIITILTKLDNNLNNDYLVNLEKQKQLPKFDSEKILNRKRLFFNSLLENPLVDENTKDTLKVSILGFGVNGRAYLDEILKLGQLKDTELIIDVYDQEIEANFELYKNDRPAILDFVAFYSESDNENKRIYNDEKRDPLAIVNLHNNVNLDEEITDEINTIYTKNPDYYFVAFGDNQLNKRIAKALYEKNKNKDKKLKITYTVYGEAAKDFFKINNEEATILPLEIIKNFKLNKILQQIAFNIFKIWNNTVNSSNYLLEEKFNNYNFYNSSLVTGLNYLYNLQLLGFKEARIIPEDSERTIYNLNNLAQELLEGSILEENLEFLSVLDHNVWLLDKVTLGWSVPYKDLNNRVVDNIDFSILADTLGKDSHSKTSAYLVRSDSVNHLEKSKYKNKNIWIGDHKNISELDDLEKVSLKLYKAYYEKAQQFIQYINSNKSELVIIEKKLQLLNPGYIKEELLNLFNKLNFCIKNIIAGSYNFSKQFETYFLNFTEYLEENEPLLYEQIHSILETLRFKVRVIKKSNFLLDYKEKNRESIRNIPFILTNHSDMHVLKKFKLDKRGFRTSILFENIASISIVQPKELSYFLILDNEISINDLDISSKKMNERVLKRQNKNEEEIVEQIKLALNFLYDRKVKSDIRFYIFSNNDGKNLQKRVLDLNNSFTIKNDLEEKIPFFNIKVELRDLSNKSILDELKNLCYDNQESIVLDKSHTFYNNEDFKKTFYDDLARFPWFKFNSKSNTFTTSNDLKFLSYINKDAYYLKVQEMFALSEKPKSRLNLPEFHDIYEGATRS